MRVISGVGFLAVAGMLWVAQAADPKAPEVGEWEISLKPLGDNDKAQPYGDVLTLKDGRLQTKVNSKYGFDSPTYTKKAAGGLVEITAVQKHKEHGTAHWSLKVKGDELTGSMTWEKKEKSFKWQFAIAGKRM